MSLPTVKSSGRVTNALVVNGTSNKHSILDLVSGVSTASIQRDISAPYITNRNSNNTYIEQSKPINNLQHQSQLI